MTKDLLMLPRRRRDAIAEGSRYYFTGKPCKSGHFAKRAAPNGHCVECSAASWVSHYDVDYHREYNKKWRDENPDYHREYFAKNRARQYVIQVRWRYKERTTSWTVEDWNHVQELAEWKVAYEQRTGKSLRLVRLHDNAVLTPDCFGLVEKGGKSIR